MQKTAQEIVDTGKKVAASHLVEGSWGNISARYSGAGIAITPSGRAYDTLCADDISFVDNSGNMLQSKHKPSSELPLHLAIYKARPDIGAIVHTHSVYASACAAAQMPIPPIMEDIVQIAGGEVSVSDYSLPGTPELAAAALKALGGKNAVLLARHGAVACGRNLPEALTVAYIVEKTAKIFILAKQLGAVFPLDDEDIAILRGFYLNDYCKRQLVED